MVSGEGLGLARVPTQDVRSQRPNPENDLNMIIGQRSGDSLRSTHNHMIWGKKKSREGFLEALDQGAQHRGKRGQQPGPWPGPKQPQLRGTQALRL